MTTLSARRVTLALAGMLVWASCGSSRVAADGGAVTNGKRANTPGECGSVRVTIDWGSSAQPMASKAVQVTVTQQDEDLQSHVFVRPNEASASSAQRFDGVPVGSVEVRAVAFPSGDSAGNASGAPQASAVASRVVQSHRTADVALTLSAAPATVKTTVDNATPTAGSLVTVTATAYDNQDRVVLLPIAASPTWSVPTGADLVRTRTPTTSRAATDKYIRRYVALSDGPVAVQVSLPIRKDTDATQVLTRIPVNSASYVVDANRQGYAYHNYQEKYDGHIGTGYNDQTGEVCGSSPFAAEGARPAKVANGQGTQFETHWDEEVTSEDSGQSWDLGLEARYCSFNGGVHTNFARQQSTNGRTLNFSVTYVNDLGRWELDPRQLRLTPEAASLLAEPTKFVNTYGHRLIVGERRVNRVTAHFSMSLHDTAQASSMGVQWNARYGSLTTDVKTRGSLEQFLRTASKRTRIDVLIRSTNGLPAAPFAAIEKPGDVENLVNSMKGLLKPDLDNYVADRFISVPITDFIPALNQRSDLLPAIREEQLLSEFDLYRRVDRMLAYARDIQSGAGLDPEADPWSWMIPAERQNVQDAIPTLERKQSLLLGRLKQLTKGEELSPLTGGDALPPTVRGWPNPRAIAKVKQWPQGENSWQWQVTLKVYGVGDNWDTEQASFYNRDHDFLLPMPCKDWQSNNGPGPIFERKTDGPQGMPYYWFSQTSNHQPTNYTGWLGGKSAQCGHQFFYLGYNDPDSSLFIQLYGRNGKVFFRKNLNKNDV